jgi:CBS domain-containing protein
MATLKAKDIMHPRFSFDAKAPGECIVEKLTSPYPGLPVVNDNMEVIGIVTEYDVLDALKSGRTVHEFSAESIMGCGHMEHEAVCREPVVVSQDASIGEVLNLFYEKHLTVLPVVENAKNRKLVGVIARKNLMNALSEKDFWPEHQFAKRVAVGGSTVPGKGHGA